MAERKPTIEQVVDEAEEASEVVKREDVTGVSPHEETVSESAGNQEKGQEQTVQGTITGKYNWFSHFHRNFFIVQDLCIHFLSVCCHITLLLGKNSNLIKNMHMVLSKINFSKIV